MKKETKIASFEAELSSIERKMAPGHLYTRIQAKIESEALYPWSWRISLLGFMLIVVINMTSISSYLSNHVSSEKDFIYPNIASPQFTYNDEN